MQIRQAVEEKFDVKVEKIATMNRKGKKKKMSMRSGGRAIRTEGFRSNWKKAIIEVLINELWDIILQVAANMHVVNLF